MHSRIFQISPEPLKESDWINELDIPEYFCNGIADYVCECSDESRSDSIDWLLGYLGSDVVEKIDTDTILFKPIAKHAYFCDKHKTFCEMARKASEVSLEEFSSDDPADFGLNMYLLNKAYEDKFSFYIFEEDYMYDLDCWIREMRKPGPYFIGTVLDYHF